jgi:hypothetical protein
VSAGQHTPVVRNSGTKPTQPTITDDKVTEVDEASIWILGAACLFAVVALIAAAAGVLSVPL